MAAFGMHTAATPPSSLAAARRSTRPAFAGRCQWRGQQQQQVQEHRGLSGWRVVPRWGPCPLEASVSPTPSSSPSVMTDDAVPEGHRGLHDFLYDAEGDEHNAKQLYRRHEGEDDGATVLSVATYLESRDQEKPVGVYAIYDDRGNIQYIGFSRNMVLSVKGHLSRVGEDKCSHVRPMVFANRAMATKANLQQQAQNWIDECGTTPPGNGLEIELWEGRGSLKEAMSATDRLEYEDKKLKLQKAMGERLDSGVGNGQQSQEPQGNGDLGSEMQARRAKLMQALESDDWSEVIDGQTQQSLGTQPQRASPSSHQVPPPPPPSPQQQQPVVSPFARASVHRTIGNHPAAEVPVMDVASVDKALDEVRPYLVADGGNVEVMGVEDGNVYLTLQGACGTCPSSTATMKMGIERSLRSVFGSQLGEVLQVGGQDTRANVHNVDEHLNVIRPAIKNFGGDVRVTQVQDGQCHVSYAGPAPLGLGIKAAIKDKFPDIKEVIFD